MKDFEGTIDGLVSVGLGVYLVAVVLRGNLKPFLNELVAETGFLEFVVAIFIIYQLTRVPSIRPFTLPLAAGAVIILVMRIVSGTDSQAFKDFAAAKIGIFELASRLFQKQL